MAEERLQKILARAGVASRRKSEELIRSGRVKVDGQVVSELGAKADTRAKIEVDGRQVHRERPCYGIFHKPRQMLTTLSDPEGRPTARDVLKQVGVRVVPVGRLDFNTSGALLFTNDGDFAQALCHARSNVPKVYAAKVQGTPDERQMSRWSESIDIEGKTTRPAQVRFLRREEGKSWLEITISEGKNRQVRRLGDHASTPVVRLARLSHAGISTEGLRPGEWRLLTLDELKELKKKYGVPEKIRGAMLPGERPVRAASAVRGTKRATPAPRAQSPRGESSRGEFSRGPVRSGGSRSSAPRGERLDAPWAQVLEEDAAPRGRAKDSSARPARGKSAVSSGKPASFRGKPGSSSLSSGTARGKSGASASQSGAKKPASPRSFEKKPASPRGAARASSREAGPFAREAGRGRAGETSRSRPSREPGFSPRPKRRP